jgi:hypothetical protein
MFGWHKPTAPPTTSGANPGKAVKASIAFANGGRTWKEEVDIVTSLSEVLKSGSHPHAAEKSWIKLAGGLILQPRLVSLHPLENGGVQTVTTIEASHPAGIPTGVFEYQHAAGDTTQKALGQGFEGWMRGDLPVFLDALQTRPKFCGALEMNFSATDATPERKRRVILGPVVHLLNRPAASPPEEHPFCPCCLVTRTLDTMKQRIADGGFYGVRLFAMRGADGAAEADCRLNGEDWEAGKAALIKYVESWPDLGVEFRKQYVIIQDQPAIPKA